MQSTLTSESEQRADEMAGMTIASSAGAGRSVTPTRAHPHIPFVVAQTASDLHHNRRRFS
jgi:hypothetical protein